MFNPDDPDLSGLSRDPSDPHYGRPLPPTKEQALDAARKVLARIMVERSLRSSNE